MPQPPRRIPHRRPEPSKKKIRFSDIFYGALGTGILVHETVLTQTAEWSLIFAAFFLLGLIPISRADSSGFSIRQVLLLLLQQQLPEMDQTRDTTAEEAKPSDQNTDQGAG